MNALARGAYSLLLRLLTPLYLLRLWARGRAEPLYRTHLAERLGGGAPSTPGALWLHAVSLGETRAAAPLIEALRAAHPGLRLLLTHSTATGREAGAALLAALGPGSGTQRWLPYDTPGATRRFLTRHRPRLGVLMETELWPNLAHAAAKAGVPLVIANARLSARSAARGQRLRALLAPAARGLYLALAQTEADAQRLRLFGVPRVDVAGNLKFDLHPDAALQAQGAAWRAQAAAAGRVLVLAAITREGEEAALIEAWRAHPALAPSSAASGAGSDPSKDSFEAAATPGTMRPLLVIVPRHPQRFEEVARLVSRSGLHLARRSEWSDTPPREAWAADVWLGDSMREMPLYYAASRVALLGGSFAPLGGQNLIEAAACGCPLLMGPHTFNFSDAAEGALQAGGAERVADFPAAMSRVARGLQDLVGLDARGHAARAFALAHQGAAQRMAAALSPLLTD